MFILSDSFIQVFKCLDLLKNDKEVSHWCKLFLFSGEGDTKYQSFSLALFFISWSNLEAFRN